MNPHLFHEPSPVLGPLFLSWVWSTLLTPLSSVPAERNPTAQLRWGHFCAYQLMWPKPSAMVRLSVRETKSLSGMVTSLFPGLLCHYQATAHFCGSKQNRMWDTVSYSGPRIQIHLALSSHSTCRDCSLPGNIIVTMWELASLSRRMMCYLQSRPN